MQSIRSGSTTERVVRVTLVAALINTFAIAFLWDGCVGYARKNAAQVAQTLGVTVDLSSVINRKLTADEAKHLTERIKVGDSRTTVAAVLGEPSIEQGGFAYYLGAGGHLRVRWDGGKAMEVEWYDGIHTETDLAFQRGLGYALSALGLVFLAHFFLVLTTRVSLTDAGLKVRGRPIIPLGAIKSLRAVPSSKVGRVELEYSRDGSMQVVRLDHYGVKELPAILAAICDKTGLDNPLEPRKPGAEGKTKQGGAGE